MEPTAGPAPPPARYTIHLTFFLNAKHRVSLGHQTSPVHGHSWRLEVDLSATFANGSDQPVVQFAELEQAVRGILRPYEGRFLNELAPFNRYAPTTENVARFLYGAIVETLTPTGVGIERVTLWEAPTKGVTVASALPAADTLLALREAAAAAEPGDRRPPPAVPGGRGERSDRTSRPGGTGAFRVGLVAPILAVLAVLTVVGLVYRPLLAADPTRAYPWGSDTWGHLFKALFLSQAMAHGVAFPAAMPWWYAGLEPFRYWAPLPYYALAALARLGGSVFVAGAWLVPCVAALGGLSWLLFAPRLGWPAATAAAVAWSVWPDHIRVALAEGNLPRAVAVAFLPLLFLAFLDSLDRRRWPWSGLAFIVVLNLVVLSNAMAAAIACVGLAVFSVFYWWFGSSFRGFARGLALTALGLLISAWWLLPSLSGGITSVDAEAVLRATDYFPVSVSLNPTLRQTNPEVFYLGLSAIVLLAGVLVTWKRRGPLSRALFACGLLDILITLPAAQPVVSVLPGANLLWPIRFASLLPLAALGSFLARGSPGSPGEDSAAPAGRRTDVRPVIALAVAVVVLCDAAPSFGLIQTRTPRPDLAAAAQALLAEKDAWRVAVLDLSRLSSEASFVFSADARREQVYGWAWQGASIGPELVLINTALEQHRYTYAIDRALQLGASDLVVPRTLVDTDVFGAEAAEQGFTERQDWTTISLFHRPSTPPRAFLSPYRVLAIGRLAGNLSLLFPGVETGAKPLIDAYTPEELARYQTVFLTGASWRSQARAEQVIRDYLRRGGNVVVDLTGFPAGILSKRPTFLGVTGEPLEVSATPEVVPADSGVRFSSFTGYDPWVALVPQGLDRVTLSFDHYGQPAPILGEKDVEGRPVTFVGLNLPYHALLTGDQAALDILGRLTGLEPGEAPVREATPLDDYRALSTGYTFKLEIPSTWSGRPVILPFAARDSLRVSVDGQPVKTGTVEQLLSVPAAPGTHKVAITAVRPPLAGVSALVSVASALLFLGYIASQLGRTPVRRKELTA